MFKTRILALLFLLAFQASFAQIEPYKIFDGKGKEVTFENIVKDSKKSEVIFFGELHNNSLAHWLQLQLLKNLQENGNRVILAGEFFERDDQLNIEEWFAGKMTDKNFEAEAKLWTNYQVDYKPLMLYAKKNQIPFVGTNVPRKYASMVSRKGLLVLDSLSDDAKKSIAPLPIEVDKTLPGYVGMKDMMHGSGMNADYMVEAQALKDATMAYSLFDYLEKGNSILHINGSYHSNNYEGIIWYLNKAYPKTKILTISTVEQESIKELEEKSKGIADFIIVLPMDSPKSY
ncbi:ChaN family lipoprotein [Aquiflexum gelatinilyticum]|uniref:ChaN family lipoprotein n=1 Tax=Aquiflexum gelatinilyticum TaxID=2961943 RepID=UPI00216A1453|nr:ChaN family lipoprotein [Aquiflexum gelatinilyticum]MCS4433499.1 ChaN family lipoprotein [Aquiflexum gelatinilyticum]